MLIIETFQIVQNNIIGIIILFIIFLNIKPYVKTLPLDQKMFIGMLLSTVIIMILDIVMISINGLDGATTKTVSMILSTVYFILNPMPFFLWTLYVNFKVYEDKKRLKRISKITVWPVVINAVLAVLSLFFGLVFFIDDNNIYNRGSWFWVISIICYSYSAYTVIEIFKNRNYLSRKKYYSMLLFILPPALGGLIQMLVPELKLLWVSLVISLMMVFINLQTEQLYTDALTGLHNRRHLESRLRKYRSRKNKNNVGMLMIDIDCFKNINDTFGHAEGDRALEYFSKILKDSFRRDDTIFRYAGDEFVVIIEVSKKEELERAVNRMRENIDEFNKEKITPYDINVSVGYDILDHDTHISMKSFIKHIDELMYKDKLVNCESR